MASSTTTGQSSPGILENPANGAPKAVAPNPADYVAPGTADLEAKINQDAAQPLSTVDDTAFKAQQQQENNTLAHLEGLATGAIKSDAQVQGEQQLQTAQAEAQGSTEAVRGVNPMLAMREQQQAQATSDMQAQAKIAQTAVQQQAVARTQAANLVSTMAKESQAQAALHLSADQANAQHESMVLGERMSLAGMRQQSSIAFAAAQSAYQTQQRQETIMTNMRHQEGMNRMIGGIVQAGGAGLAIAALWVADAFTLGIGTGAAAVGTAGLAGVVAHGVYDIQGGKAEADSNPES